MSPASTPNNRLVESSRRKVALNCKHRKAAKRTVYVFDEQRPYRFTQPKPWPSRPSSPSPCFVNANKVMKHLTAFRCQVLKLFAKHLKIEEQKVMLRKGCFPLAVRRNFLVEPPPPPQRKTRCTIPTIRALVPVYTQLYFHGDT